jgi:APA family basic amino acid/polyamine antiporter
MPEASAYRRSPQLVRDLTASHATAVVVGTIIGTGIFLVPTEMMQAAGSAKLVYLAWMVGGVLSFLGALGYAELGAMKPEAGGEYVYMRDGYGPLPGFLYAWTTFLIAKPGSIATISVGIVRILGTFAALAFLPGRVIEHPIPVTWGQLAAIGLVVFISFINYIGVRKAGEFQLFFTLFKIAIVLGVIGIAFSYHGGAAANFATSYAGAKGGLYGFMLALVAALWAYDGWNNLNMVAGEIRRPERSVPIALIAGVGTVAALYMLMNAAVQYVMPAARIAASGRPASDAVLIALGAGAATLFAGAMAVQMLATLNGAILSGARIPFAAAHDGYFVPQLARVHPRYHTPSASIVFQGILAAVLVLLVGKFQQLFSITLFAEWLFYMLTTGTLFIFRRRQPDLPRPYKTWGYPVVPAIFMLASAVLLGYTFWDNLKYPAYPSLAVWLQPPLNSLSTAGVLVILLGIPVYYAFARRAWSG